MKIVAVFASDTHLSEATWNSRVAIRGDSFFGFVQAVDKAVQHGCPLIITGDCWELMHQPRPSSVTIEFVRSQLDRLAAANCPFYFINGQHDQLASPYWFNAIHHWPRHVGQQSFQLGGMPWFGLDFFEVAQAEQQLALIPPDTYGVLLHQQWQQFTDSKFLSPMSLDIVPHARVAISGDMHKTVIDDTGARLYISPGATHMRSLAEPMYHSVVLLDSSGKFTTETLKSRKVITWQIYRAADMYEQMENIRAQVQAALQLSVDSDFPIEVARPLLIVEDYAVCDAVQVVQQAINEAHVVSRRVNSKQEQSQVEAAEVLDTTLDVRELFLRIAIERDPANERRAAVLRALVYGEDPVESAIKVSG